MLWWFADSINSILVFLSIVALCFAVAFYLTRRVKFLGIAIGIVGGMVVLWFLASLIITDRKQLELNLRAMADAVVAGKTNVLREHLAPEFEFRDMTRDEAIGHSQRIRLSSIKVWAIDVEPIDRAKKTAKVRFAVTVHTANDETWLGRFEASFTLSGERWLLGKLNEQR